MFKCKEPSQTPGINWHVSDLPRLFHSLKAVIIQSGSEYPFKYGMKRRKIFPGASGRTLKTLEDITRFSTKIIGKQKVLYSWDNFELPE
jgi:hypothetical protein